MKLMMTKVSARLPLSPEDAWHLLVEWEAQSRWMKDAESVRVLGSDREGVGVRVAVRTRVLGLWMFTDVLEIERWEPPRRLVIAHRGLVHGIGVWVLEPAAGGSLFRWLEDVRLPVPVLGELALLAYRPIMRRLMNGSARALVGEARR